MHPNYKKKLINEMRQIQVNKRQRSSRLDQFKNEILILRHFKLSYDKIAKWLNEKYQIKISSRQIIYMVNNVWCCSSLIKEREIKVGEE